ncbi:MAG: hypothetical protein QNK89_00860, partial [Lacinutrix sp.]|uniref:hypothetical protein n=1 Tax=Lacinutrix sp. TaxID=1937692 RepID=UPI00309E24EA
YDLYNLILGNPAYSSVEVINNNLPNALEKTAAFTKVYFKDQSITITNNLFDKYTYFFKIDLSKNTVDLRLKKENKLLLKTLQ